MKKSDNGLRASSHRRAYDLKASQARAANECDLRTIRRPYGAKLGFRSCRRQPMQFGLSNTLEIDPGRRISIGRPRKGDGSSIRRPRGILLASGFRIQRTRLADYARGPRTTVVQLFPQNSPRKAEREGGDRETEPQIRPSPGPISRWSGLLWYCSLSLEGISLGGFHDRRLHGALADRKLWIRPDCFGNIRALGNPDLDRTAYPLCVVVVLEPFA